MRINKLFSNVFLGLILQIVSIISGFIVPITYIKNYGSDINGLIITITQFLSYISLLEGGVGGVIRARLFAPLASEDNKKVSGILKASNKFFYKLGYVLIVYIAFLCIMLPLFVETNIDSFLIITLTVVIGLSTLAQYFFGISNQILLQADQKQYITNFVLVISIVINTIVIYTLSRFKIDIEIIIFFSSLIFFIRPMILKMYVKKNYTLVKIPKSNEFDLKGKWDGIGHHLAYTLQNSSPVIILVTLTNLTEVSVYSVYLLVVNGIKKIITTFSIGVESTFGNMIAKKEKNNINEKFSLFEFFIYNIVTITFSTALVLIIPFVNLYIDSPDSELYVRPAFAYTLIISEAIFCIRMPYSSLIFAAGHYKETRNGAIFEAMINVIMSSILVFLYGLIGIAIGYLIAVSIRTIQYIIYSKKNILNSNYKVSLKQLFIYGVCFAVIVAINNLFFSFKMDDFFEWIIQALISLHLSIVILIINNFIFFKDIQKRFISILFHSFKNLLRR